MRMRRVSNGEIAEALMNLSQLLEVRRENPFRVKAYRRAARTVRALSESLFDLTVNGANIKAYPSIGPAVSRMIRELVETGTLNHRGISVTLTQFAS